ncbi:MAG: YceI family protein [Bdellovibrionaceae bacterium]|nr:YceI family protein [Bdellovibrio sp.]
MKSIILAVALIASTAVAQPKKITKKVKDAIASQTAVKKDVEGKVLWIGYGVGKSHDGTINIKEGQVELKNEELVGGHFVLDMPTLQTNDSPKLQGHLRSADFFGVEKYKEATFKITSVEKIKDAKAGEPNYKIKGDLKIKDKTNPEEFKALVIKENEKWTATAETEIKDRTKYDIVYNSAQFKSVSALGDKLIEDKIKIKLDLKTK